MILDLNLLILVSLFNSIDCCRDRHIPSDSEWERRHIQNFVSEPDVLHNYPLKREEDDLDLLEAEA